MEHVRWVLSNLQPADWAQIIAGLVAIASAISKLLEVLIRMFPSDAKLAEAKGILAFIASALSKLQASPVLQSLAMSPKLGAPSHPAVVYQPPAAAVSKVVRVGQ